MSPEATMERRITHFSSISDAYKAKKTQCLTVPTEKNTVRSHFDALFTGTYPSPDSLVDVGGEDGGCRQEEGISG